MNLVYFTSQKYPSKKTEPFYAKSMAHAFSALQGKRFTFVVREVAPPELDTIQTLSLAAPRRGKAFFYFVSMPWLVVQHGWRGPDTVFFSYDPYLLAALLFWRTVARFHYQVASDWHQLFEDWRDAYIARRSDYLFATSKKLARLLVERAGAPPERVSVAYGGVNTAPFVAAMQTPKGELRERLGLPAEAYLVGYVGGFTSVGLRKGLDTMLAALPLLPEDLRMAFVGGTAAEVAEYRALAEELGVAGRCVFAQRQPFDKVVEYELAMDVLVIPYPDLPHFREWGFPMKVWEYMAAGRPILYSNLELIGEVLEGRAVPFVPGSPESLAEALLGVYKNRAAAEVGAARNPAAVQSYTWEGRARGILEFLNQ